MPRHKGLERAINGLPGNRKVTSSHGLSAYSVDGLTPAVAVFPNTLEEVSNLLSLADKEGKKVVPWGGGTMVGLGNVPAGVDLVIGMQRMNRILEYEPSDLTVIMEGGASLKEVQEELSEHGQFLPLDPPCSEEATIGGILATHASGPRRAFFGSVRDRLIGIKVVHPNGQVTKGGGKVVKNVSGYDMNKLYTGSLGTLGIIVEAAFKTVPVYREALTLFILCPSLDSAQGLAHQIYKRGVQPTALQLLDSEAINIVSASCKQLQGVQDYSLVIELQGTPAAVERQKKEVEDLARGGDIELVAVSDKEDMDRLWKAIRDFGRSQGTSATMIFKSTCLPSKVGAAIEEVLALEPKEEVRRAVISNIATGTVYSYWWSKEGDGLDLKRIVEDIRTISNVLGGNSVVEACPLEVKQHIDVWGVIGPQIELMRRIKEQYDPSCTLNPGRFVARI